MIGEIDFMLINCEIVYAFVRIRDVSPRRTFRPGTFRPGGRFALGRFAPGRFALPCYYYC